MMTKLPEGFISINGSMKNKFEQKGNAFSRESLYQLVRIYLYIYMLHLNDILSSRCPMSIH